jgi:ribosomal protein S12 methylthiotransferase
VPRTFWVETLGCPKNQVDSDKLAGRMLADGLIEATSPDSADLVVVNTCAFVEEAREESVAVVLDLDDVRSQGSELVVTGCLAERYGDELAEALPEADVVAGFGVAPDSVTDGAVNGAVTGGAVSAVAVEIGSRVGPRRALRAGDDGVPALDLLNLPRPPSSRPWAYVKVAEGCDKACGFCAIPSFRGPQRSRSLEAILDEVDQLAVREVVLIAQDLGAFGRDGSVGRRRIVELVEAVSVRVDWVRLLYLYPSELTDELIELVAASPVPYFDLSLQHVSGPLVRRMRRPGDGAAYLGTVERARALNPQAAFRSNFIVGYPGETEADHDQLLAFLQAAQLDWCGFFAYSEEEGTHAAELEPKVPAPLVAERLAELRELQDAITAARRDELIGTEVTVLVDEAGLARSHREAPEIDGMIWVPEDLAVGELHRVRIVAAEGPDLHAVVAAVQPESEAELHGAGTSARSSTVSGGDR